MLNLFDSYAGSPNDVDYQLRKWLTLASEENENKAENVS